MISSTFTKVALAATALLATANGHMVMKTPIPYGRSTLNNSPLDPSGSDFPCKLRPGAFELEGAENIMAIGEPQTLSFTGSAVHGGGSCQVALTTDLQPTKQSKWMVIKSIEGGCPANVAGNLPADPNGSGASTFQYTVPEGIAPGQYTIAWGWMNKIGNREYYMNCGPATVVGAKKKRYNLSPKVSKRVESFPDLCVANLAGVSDITTEESKEYVFPNPGPDVERAGSGPFQTLPCGSAANAPAQPSSASPPTAPASSISGAPGYTSQPSAPSAPGPDQSVSVPAFAGPSSPPANGNPIYSDKPQQTGGPGIFASGASVVPVTLSTATIPSSTGASTGIGSGTNGSTSSTSDSGDTCEPGDWQCSQDGSSFRRCTAGSNWSVPMQMAAGLKCTPGTSHNLEMSKTVKRSHLHGHLRRMNTLGDSVH